MFKMILYKSTLFFLFSVIIFCKPLQAQVDEPQKVLPKQSLDVNLLDEECEASPRLDVLPPPGLPMDKMVFCDNELVGSVSSAKIFINNEVSDVKSKLLQVYESTASYNLNQKRMSCKKGGELLQNIGWKRAVGIACKLKNGGWPHILLLLPRGEKLFIAEGSPSLLPTLISAVYPKRKEEFTKTVYSDMLKQIYGGEVPLASSSDLKNFDSIVINARTANTQGRYKDSEDLFRKALDLQSKLLNKNDISIAETLMDLALNVSNQGNDEEALALFRRAEPIIQVSPLDSDRARFISYQGYHAANFKKYEEALQFASGAVSAWRKIASGPNLNFDSLFGEPSDSDPRAFDKGELALALNLQANMALRVEQLGLAQAAAAEALQILNDTKGLPKWWKSDVLLTLGKISSAQGRLSASEKFLNAALAVKGIATGDGPQLLPIRIALATAYQVEGMNTSSIITYRQIFKKINSFAIGTKANLSKEDIIPFALAITNHAQTLQNNIEKQGLFNEAFDAFQLLRPSVVEQTVNRTTARLAIDNAELRELIEKIQVAERDRDAANIELSYETALPDDQRSKIIEDKLILRKKVAFVRILKTNKELNDKFPEYSNLIKPKLLDTIEFRERLTSTEGVISFIIGKKVSFIQLIRRDGIYLGQIKEGEDSISESVEELRKALIIKGGYVSDFDLALSHSLYKRLFKSIDNKLSDLNHLIVIPSGPLASLPFSLLVEKKPSENTKYSNASWLIQRVAISHSPSLTSFYAQRTISPSKRPSKNLLAFGNPDLKGQSIDGTNKKNDSDRQDPAVSALATSCRKAGPASAELIRSLSPLPETEKELSIVSKVLNHDRSKLQFFSKESATEKIFRDQNLSDYKVIYFATHGLLPGELKCQSEPGLVLTPPIKPTERENDGLLEASEIASLKINAEIVVLSACNTAGSGGKFGGDALSGLAEAFFFAGARTLVVSHWQVPSKATADLMSEMFKSLGPKLKTGSALSLRDAQKKLISNEITAHPFFWGAFVIVGDGVDESWLPIPRENQNNIK